MMHGSCPRHRALLWFATTSFVVTAFVGAVVEAWSAPEMPAATGAVPVETVRSDGIIKNGPLVVITHVIPTAHGYRNVGHWLDFNSTRGRWRVVLFVQLNTPNVGPVAQNEISNEITAIGRALTFVPNVEIWIVQMNEAITPERGIPERPVMFGVGCAGPMQPCFDHYIYGAAVPGKDDLFYWPQADWFMKTFPHLFEAAAYRDHAAGGKRVYPIIQLPYWAIISPGNVVYGERSEPDAQFPWHSDGFEANKVLIALNSLMVKRGDKPILTYRTNQDVGFGQYLRATWLPHASRTARHACVPSIYNVPGANLC